MIVGFIGSGNMAAGMARGWASARSAGDGGPESMLFTDSGSGRARALAGEVGGEAVTSSDELRERCDLLVLAMKPAGLEDVAAGIQGAKTVVSILGATSVAKLEAALPGTEVFRLMPNLGVEVRRGTLCLSYQGSVAHESVDGIKALLAPLGKVVVLADEQIDTATALMGCTPAYFALAAEAIAAAGVADGIDADTAGSLVAESMAGAAGLLSKYAPGQILAAVASPGGSTEAGLDALAGHSTREAFRAAVEASLDRMRGR